MASLRSHHHCLETQIKRHKRSDERPCADSENPLSDFEVLLDSGNMASERWPGEDACDREEDACEHEEDACDPEKEDACEQMDRRTALDRLEDQLRRGARLTPRSRDLLEERVEADRRRLAEVQMAEAEVQTTTVMQLADAAAQADAGEQEEVQVADADVQTTVCQQADAAAQADAGEQAEVQMADAEVQTPVCQQADAAAQADAGERPVRVSGSLFPRWEASAAAIGPVLGADVQMVWERADEEDDSLSAEQADAGDSGHGVVLPGPLER